MGSTLALLAIAPLLGLAFLAVGRLTDANRANTNLNQVQQATTELVEVVELQAAIQNENFWLATKVGIDALGYPQGLVALTLGIDPVEELELSQLRTDQLVARADLDGLAEAITEARQSPTGRAGVQGPFDVIESEIVKGAVLEKVESVIALSAEQPDGSHLVVLARKLQGTNEVRSSFSGLRAAFFANFDELDVDERRSTMLELAKRQVLYERELEELDLLIPPGGALVEPFDALLTGEDRMSMLSAIDGMLADFGYIVNGQTADPERPASGDAINSPAFGASATGTPIALNFARAETVTDEHLQLVTTAAAVLTKAVEVQRKSAQTSAMVVLAASLAIALLTVGAMIATTRWIVRPLADLGRTALALTLGGDGSLPPARGPHEIRLIHEALTEAITNLERTEQQAIALADGALDDPSLDRVVPGRFGATLNAAIEQLRRSISRQEESSDLLAYEAGHDGLTGLPNRRSAIDFLTNALAESNDIDIDAAARPKTAVFFIDLDHFKQVNDTLGHAAGDNVLRTVAKALRSSTRATDMVGRIGGDEFLIVSNSPNTLDEASAMGERYLDAINTSLSLESGEIGASIGVAIGGPGDGVDTLLAEADMAMLEAKKQGRDAVRAFDSELRARTLDEVTLSTSVRSGLEAGEFQLHYQPIVDAVSGEALDYEALIRWDRPGVGRVPPDDYIPFAERSDLVIDIDRWVLNEAVGTLATNVLDRVGVAINISGRHLANGDLFADLTDVLNRYAVDPELLTIEITESALLGDIDGAIDTLRRVRALGVKIAIDDFGTGFTSLTHLRSLPADVLKIDQSFTSNLDNSDDANLVRLVIQTAHVLRLDVVVEGVEDLSQAQRVTMLGADQMQGYFFAKPMSIDDVIDSRRSHAEKLTMSQTSSHR